MNITAKSHPKITIGIILFVFLILVCLTLIKNRQFPMCEVSAQEPEPYVTCQNIRPRSILDNEIEFHSLRPYQASPCVIPLKTNEQALICGNDLIVNDTIIIPNDDHEVLYCQPCSSCPGMTYCWIKAPRRWVVALNAHASELPIAGQTEQVPGGNGQNINNPLIDESRLTDFLKTTWIANPLPPFLPHFSPHSPPNVNQFDDFQDYYIAYKEWRGNICFSINIPFLSKDIVLCLDDPLNPNFWSKQFPNIPYTSTEDRLGKARVSRMFWDQDKSSVAVISPNPPNTGWNPFTPPYGSDPNIQQIPNVYGETPLYFPHMEETVEATSLLQSTYLPPEILEKEQPIGEVTPVPPSGDQCKIVDVRHNPGDQLFGEKVGDLGVPNADVSYDAYFWCEAQCIKVCPFYFCDCIIVPACVKNAWFHSDVETYTPMVDELFSKTVSGNASVVKKIFPKIEENTPISEIKDIPAVTNVEHQARGDNSHAHVQVISKPAEFYIPHLGSIYDYFLHMIQTAIRPKGFEAQPAGLQDNAQIQDADTVNEYVSWYLHGTEYLAENDPLNPKDPEEINKVVNYTGPINKLLSQHSQWRNKFKAKSVSYDEVEFQQGRVDQVNKAQQSRSGNDKIRHDQIVGCVWGIPIPFLNWEIGGFPVACKLAYQDQLPPVSTPGSTPTPTSGTCPQVADSEIDQKYLNMKSNFIRMADAWVAGENLAEECYNYVVKTANSRGVNPAFTLAIWLHESGASNYDYASNVLDFGVNNAPPADIVAQLDGFLQLPFASSFISCSQQSGWTTRMHAFLSRYKHTSGQCDPFYQPGLAYHDDLLGWYQNICDPVKACVTCNPQSDPSCASPRFLISWPTDMSCP